MLLKRINQHKPFLRYLLILISVAVIGLFFIYGDPTKHSQWGYSLLIVIPSLFLCVIIFMDHKQIRSLHMELHHQDVKLHNTKKKLDQLQTQLDKAVPLAATAELTTGILHNVGNVLNGVNVSASQITDFVRDTNMGNLGAIVKLMQDQGKNLANFIDSDQGHNLVQALAQLEQIREDETEQVNNELRELTKGINHMRNIIDLQQATAKHQRTYEAFKISSVIEDSLHIYTNSLQRMGIAVDLQLDEQLLAQADRPSVVHILVNLISNARNAIAEQTENRTRQITIQTHQIDSWAQIKIMDSGGGIDPKNLPNLFEYGFTTRYNGHGFGLHHSINAARELGGTLTASSDGIGKGATFTLRVPTADNNTCKI